MDKNNRPVAILNSLSWHLSKGPSINDVGTFFQFYDPPPSPFVVFLISKFRHFWRPPSPLRRRRLWMAPSVQQSYLTVSRNKKEALIWYYNFRNSHRYITAKCSLILAWNFLACSLELFGQPWNQWKENIFSVSVRNKNSETLLGKSCLICTYCKKSQYTKQI